MKRTTFFAVCMLSLGGLLGGSVYAQTTLRNESPNFTVGNGALLSVHGETQNEGNLTVNPEGMVNLHDDLHLGVNPDNKFTLQSTSYTKTGSLIGYASQTTPGQGKLISERYITAGPGDSDAKWHYFTSPVSGQPLNETWMTDNYIAYNTTANYGQLDFWRWNEPSSSWVHFTDNDFNRDTFMSGYGYITAVKADGRAQQGVLEFKGDNYNGPALADEVVVPVTTDGIENPPYHCWKSWNLIGNPYPSAYNIKKWIDYNQNRLDSCHVAVYIYVEESSDLISGETGNGSNNFQFCSVEDYKVISNNGTGFNFNYYYVPNGGNVNDPEHIGGLLEELSNAENQYIAPGQAFFIKVVEGTTEMPFPVGTASDITTAPITGMKDVDDYRAHAFANATYRSDREVWPSFALLVNNTDGHASSSIVSFNEKMTTGLDRSCDVARLRNPNQALSVYTQMLDKGDYIATELQQQALPFLEENTSEEGVLSNYELPVGLDVKNTMNVNFNVIQDQLDDKSIVLEDRKLNEFTNLRENNYVTTVDQSESGFGRFYIHFGPESEEEIVTSNQLQISAYMVDKHQLKVLNPATVKADYQIIDLNGNLLSDGRLNGDNEQVIHVDLPLAMYFLRVNTTAETQTFKFINK